MAKVGKKPTYNKNFHPEEFIRLSAQGKHKTQIARDFGVQRQTINRWIKKYSEFGSAVKKGKGDCKAWWIDLGVAAMLNKARDAQGRPVKVNLGFYVWLTKNLFKWSDKIQQKSAQTHDVKADLNVSSKITRELIANPESFSLLEKLADRMDEIAGKR